MSIISVIIGNLITIVCVLGYIKYSKNISLDNFAEKIASRLKKNAN